MPTLTGRFIVDLPRNVGATCAVILRPRRRCNRLPRHARSAGIASPVASRLASGGCSGGRGQMSNFVQFPIEDYRKAGNVFAAFDPGKSTFTLPNALAMMWFAQLSYEVDTSGQN